MLRLARKFSKISNLGVIFVLTTSLVTQSCQEECASLVTVLTTGTSQQRAIVILRLDSVSSVSLKLKVSTVRPVLKATMEMPSTVTVWNVHATYLAQILRGLLVTGTLASVTVFQMLLESIVMNVLKTIGKLPVERVVRHVPVTQLVR